MSLLVGHVHSSAVRYVLHLTRQVSDWRTTEMKGNGESNTAAPSDADSVGKFSFSKIYNYLRHGKYPEETSKVEKNSLRRRVCSKCKEWFQFTKCVWTYPVKLLLNQIKVTHGYVLCVLSYVMVVHFVHFLLLSHFVYFLYSYLNEWIALTEGSYHTLLIWVSIFLLHAEVPRGTLFSQRHAYASLVKECHLANSVTILHLYIYTGIHIPTFWDVCRRVPFFTEGCLYLS